MWLGCVNLRMGGMRGWFGVVGWGNRRLAPAADFVIGGMVWGNRRLGRGGDSVVDEMVWVIVSWRRGGPFGRCTRMDSLL